MAQPQPVIHPPPQHDHPMPSPSYSSFNPASYTRTFFGSPVSWRPGSSMESDRGSVKDALSAMEREDELVSLFTPGFVFSLLSNRLPFPHSAAITLAVDSPSRIFIV